jgi:hypothetical protein
MIIPERIDLRINQYLKHQQVVKIIVPLGGFKMHTIVECYLPNNFQWARVLSIHNQKSWQQFTNPRHFHKKCVLVIVLFSWMHVVAQNAQDWTDGC